MVAACTPAITAADVRILPPSQTITVGQTAFVDVQVSGIKPAAVGAFDFTFGYDPALVQVSSVGFGADLSIGTLGSSPGLRRLGSRRDLRLRGFVRGFLAVGRVAA